MRPDLLKLDRFSKKQIEEEIEEGIGEYLTSPRSREGAHADLSFAFDTEKAEKSIRREEIEREVEDFIGKNFEKFLPTLLSQDDSYGDRTELLKKLGLTNQEIGLLGVNYYIREQDGQLVILQTDEYYPEGRHAEISSSDLLALAYAKENVRIDSRKEIGRRLGGGWRHTSSIFSQIERSLSLC